MKNISWNNVRQGDIVQFRYKGVRPNAKARIRTVLVLNANHKKSVKDGTVRLVHGIELTAIPSRVGVITKQEKERMVVAAAEARGLEYKQLDKSVERIAIVEGNAKSIYAQLRTIVSKHGNYRTYRYDRAKKYPVRLDTEYDWPKVLVDELKVKFNSPK